MITLLAACAGGDDGPRPPPTDGPTGHTGTAPVETIGWGPCGAPVAAVVTLVPEDEGDAAGYALDLADVDGDGCDEVAVSADFSWNPWRSYVTSRSSLHVLHRPDRSGALVEVAATTWREDPEVPFPEGAVLYDFGSSPLLLPATRQVVAGGRFRSELDPRVVVYDLPVPQPGGVLPATPWRQALLDVVGVEDSKARCGGDALCVSTPNRSDAEANDWAGHVFAYDLPLDRQQAMEDHRTWLHGDPGDRAHLLGGGGDVDGDGVDDLLVGAFKAGGVGAVAVVTALPASGAHRLWDVASARLEGVEWGAEFGAQVTAADVSGDGLDDVIVAAPQGEGTVYVFFAPLRGTVRAWDADVVVRGSSVGELVGRGLAAADFTGDGGVDLAVGAPWSWYLPGVPPGRVLVFDDPRGELRLGDADWVFTSGSRRADAFGWRLRAGDLDGDGRGDLVIGAPRDPRVAPDAGSVTIVYGAAWPP
jgi:hypothetical protein